MNSGTVKRVVPGRVPSVFPNENVQSIDSESPHTNRSMNAPIQETSSSNDEVDTYRELSGGKETNIRIAYQDGISLERPE